jgi:ferredoxin
MLTGGAICGQCIRKCPYGAISSAGFDKSRCYEMRNDIRDRYLDEYVEELDMLAAPIVKSGKRKNSYSLGCALCQCGVPCEKGMPDFNT